MTNFELSNNIEELLSCVIDVLKKWSCGHKCASTVQLHAMQELWELMSEDDCVMMLLQWQIQLSLANYVYSC
jgi:hypothetical protein